MKDYIARVSLQTVLKLMQIVFWYFGIGCCFQAKMKSPTERHQSSINLDLLKSPGNNNLP